MFNTINQDSLKGSSRDSIVVLGVGSSAYVISTNPCVHCDLYLGVIKQRDVSFYYSQFILRDNRSLCIPYVMGV
jgi:hypothetical protein